MPLGGWTDELLRAPWLPADQKQPKYENCAGTGIAKNYYGDESDCNDCCGTGWDQDQLAEIS